MKKTLLTSLLVVCLSGCSAHSGQIKCETIKVVQDHSRVLDAESRDTFDRVYEYQGPGFETLYTDSTPRSGLVISSQQTPELVPLKVYTSKESNEYVEYYYNREVGPIAVTYNYYLDLKARTVETERIYNDTALSYPQFRDMEGAEEAYECAKKGYYHLSGDTVYLDETPKGFECHSFLNYSEEAEVTYTELK